MKLRSNILMTLSATESSGGIIKGEESRRLARAYRAGSVPARDALIVGNLPLIKCVINRMQIPANLWDDAFQEGAIAMLRAAELYDPDRPQAPIFGTYAYVSILRKLIRFMQESTSLGKRETPVESFDEIAVEHDFQVQDIDDQGLQNRDWERMMAHLTKREQNCIRNHTEGVPLQEIADQMGLSKERVRQIRNKGVERLRRLMRS